MITNPPPKVQALNLKVEKNNFLYFFKMFNSRVYLKTPNVTGSEKFLR